MNRSILIFNEFKKIKNNLKTVSNEKQRCRILKKLFVLKGQFKEARNRLLIEREYQRNYRDENRIKIRRYHAQYARMRRRRKKLEDNAIQK